MNKRLKLIFSAAVFILLIPLIAMQFTNQVNWKLMDFAVAAFLLFGTGFLCELVFRKTSNTLNRIIFCLVLLISLITIWAELAVGIFGFPFGGK